MRRLDDASHFGWIESAQAWIDSVESDTNRTHLLDPIMLDLCGVVEGSVVVDIGCGEGRFCRMLKARGANCIAIDPIERMVRAARETDGGTPCIRASGAHVPLASACAELTVSYLSLIDIPDYRSAIGEMARILKPGGRLVIANVHSMASAFPGWIRDELGNRLYWRVDQYFRESGDVAAWSGIEVLNWHRPLESYMQAFLSAGLRLDRFIEPRPTPAQAEAKSAISDQLRVPNFVAMTWSKR